MERINYFVANTPFQVYSIKQIIDEYFINDYQNIIYVTFNDLSVTENTDKRLIRRGLASITDIRRLMRDVQCNVKSKVEFFIPHIGNLISYYFFTVSLEYNKPINVFYEGTAQFCPWGGPFSFKKYGVQIHFESR